MIKNTIKAASKRASKSFLMLFLSERCFTEVVVCNRETYQKQRHLYHSYNFSDIAPAHFSEYSGENQQIEK